MRKIHPFFKNISTINSPKYVIWNYFKKWFKLGANDK